MPVVRPLRGAIELRWPEIGWKLTMELLYMKPKPGVITPDEEPSEWVSAMQLPLLSTAVAWVVSGCPVAAKLTSIGSLRSMCARQWAARSLDIIHSVGTWLKFGSAIKG